MYAINSYSHNGQLVETISLCKTRAQAESLLADSSYLAKHRSGMTIVIERVGAK